MFGTSLACSVGISYVPQTDKCGRTRVHPKRNATWDPVESGVERGVSNY